MKKQQNSSIVADLMKDEKDQERKLENIPIPAPVLPNHSTLLWDMTRKNNLSRPYLRAVLEDCLTCDALIDSGSTISLISETLLDELNPPVVSDFEIMLCSESNTSVCVSLSIARQNNKHQVTWSRKSEKQSN